ncbi:hypothetical protein CQA38_04335 [Campylobacter sp. MIT 12-5580]|uniref:hypothetical protein n=1 Tax=Campylobacter sp. MIT 12-5580 TaxID=2040651 RepID=UPI0010F4B062|nr:hypothetical protein [Campylobacter sp. MIT 12-5580]TKX29316.1 hypothetical protein CQA38_04335 [Campylobacter sp. MIT 12-5580]
MAHFVDKLNENLEKIDNLELSFYEKDLLFSAYYHHLNHLKISPQAKELMQKLGISFKHKNILVASSSSFEAQENKEYKFDFFECKEQMQFLQNQSEHFLKQIKQILNEVLDKHELTFSKINTIYNKLTQNKAQLEQALNELIDNFTQGFNDLETKLQEELRYKGNMLLTQLNEQKNLAAKLCFKMLELKNKEKSKQHELQALIKELDAYLR